VSRLKSDKRVGNYRLVRHLGAGSSGSNVYEAQLAESDDEPNPVVALKVLSSSQGAARAGFSLARFLREVELTRELPRHPNFVAGLDSGIDDAGNHYLAMQYLHGQTLDAVLRERGRLDWREATQMALQIARALAHLSAHGVVHRDLKPDNIMICACAEGGMESVLIDLGLARRTNDQDQGSQAGDLKTTEMRRMQTPAFCAIGSPAFMAPEQVQDARSASHAADVYGLGATWYAAVTGMLPFNGSSPAKVMQQVAARHARSRPQMPCGWKPCSTSSWSTDINGPLLPLPKRRCSPVRWSRRPQWCPNYPRESR
jgi:serine/threonine protein kinase